MRMGFTNAKLTKSFYSQLLPQLFLLKLGFLAPELLSVLLSLWLLLLLLFFPPVILWPLPGVLICTPAFLRVTSVFAILMSMDDPFWPKMRPEQKSSPSYPVNTAIREETELTKTSTVEIRVSRFLSYTSPPMSFRGIKTCWMLPRGPPRCGGGHPYSWMSDPSPSWMPCSKPCTKSLFISTLPLTEEIREITPTDARIEVIFIFTIG